MTKTLTEQWKDGKLEKGTYWCVSSWTDEIRMFYFEGDYFIDCDVPLDDDNIEEVLEPVPSYEAWKESQKKRALWFEEKAKIRNRLENKIKLLEEQLNYALETMGQIAKLSDNTVDSVQCAHAICLIEERLKEMKGVKL